MRLSTLVVSVLALATFALTGCAAEEDQDTAEVASASTSSDVSDARLVGTAGQLEGHDWRFVRHGAIEARNGEVATHRLPEPMPVGKHAGDFERRDEEVDPVAPMPVGRSTVATATSRINPNSFDPNGEVIQADLPRAEELAIDAGR